MTPILHQKCHPLQRLGRLGNTDPVDPTSRLHSDAVKAWDDACTILGDPFFELVGAKNLYGSKMGLSKSEFTKY